MAARPLTALESALRQVIEDVRQAGVKFALVGGLAVSVRAEPRLTRDVDLAVIAGDDSEAEEIIGRMTESGYMATMVLEHDAADRLGTVRLVNEALGDVVLTLLFASSGIESEIVRSAEELEILADLTIPVATTGHLIATKTLARDDRNRPADYDDLRNLLEVATPEDLAQARIAIDLIEERGFSRGRDLAADLRKLESDMRD